MTKIKNLAFLLPAFVGGGLLFFRYLPERGLLGHDYSHYFARLLIGADHFWKNGFRVPHFTPYLCGGVPFFADPQSIYYSLPQFLAFFWEVLPATYLSFAVFYALGYWGMWKLSREEFCFENKISHFVALLFLLNGFSFSHLFVGHITHMPFLLAPWLLLFFFRGNVALFTLIIYYCVYSGALHVLVVFLGMLLLFFPYVLAKRGVEALSKFSLVSLALILVGSAAKLYAAYQYSSHFYMHQVDSSGLGLFQLFRRYFWFDPFNTPHQIPFREWLYGAWEYTASVSRLTAVLSVAGASYLVCSHRKRFQVWGATLAIATLLMILSLGTSLNSELPFFHHYHNPLKILAAFLVPILVLSGISLQRLSKELTIKAWVWPLLSGLVLLEFFVSSEFLLRNPSALKFANPAPEFQKIRASGGLPAVTQIIPNVRDDYASMKEGKTNLACYEPLFGYRLEKFKPLVTAGDNSLTHAGCLLYPSSLGCAAWSIVSDPVELGKFRSGKQMETWVPFTQRFLDLISLLSIIIVILMATLKPAGLPLKRLNHVAPTVGL